MLHHAKKISSRNKIATSQLSSLVKTYYSGVQGLCPLGFLLIYQALNMNIIIFVVKRNYTSLAIPECGDIRDYIKIPYKLDLHWTN